jgi:hypothetical protein
MRSLLITAMLLGASALVASPASLAAAADPCMLISVADASTALGATPPKGKAAKVGAYKLCTYTVKKKTVTVKARRVATKSAFEKAAKATPGGPVYPIHGVGADAFSAANGSVMLVWANGVEVTLVFGGVQPFVATQQSLAKTAVGRLS